MALANLGFEDETQIRKPALAEKREAKSWPIWEKEKSTSLGVDDQETCLLLEGKRLRLSLDLLSKK